MACESSKYMNSSNAPEQNHYNSPLTTAGNSGLTTASSAADPHEISQTRPGDCSRWNEGWREQFLARLAQHGKKTHEIILIEVLPPGLGYAVVSLVENQISFYLGHFKHCWAQRMEQPSTTMHLRAAECCSLIIASTPPSTLAALLISASSHGPSPKQGSLPTGLHQSSQNAHR